MKTFFITLILIMAIVGWSFAQNDPFFIPDSVILKSSEKTILFNDQVIAMPLWPDGLPDNSIEWNEDEYIENRSSDQNEFGFNRAVHKVENPGLIVFKADNGDALKPAIVIFPGGSCERIVIDKEGIDVARWYNKFGITAIIVKYRTLTSPQYNIYQALYSDAQRAMRIVRSNAAEWSIDPDKIGVMGFSAGGWLSRTLLTDYSQGMHQFYDATGRVSFYPNFCCLVYTKVPQDFHNLLRSTTAPTFLTGCKDDDLVNEANYQAFANIMAEYSIPCKVQLYDSGGHGYGLGIRGGEVTSWPQLFLDWLVEIDMATTVSSVENPQNDMSGLPRSFELFQNYPNPFNPSTTIKYNLAESNHVTLTIYNLAGQEIETLVNGYQTAGAHEISWQAAGLPSGIYFCRLQAGNPSGNSPFQNTGQARQKISEVKKLILQK